MNFKVVNHLWKTEDGKELRIVSFYPSFEEASSKIIKDLNSLWKGIVPMPYRLEFLETDEERSGMFLMIGDEIVSDNMAHNATTEDILETYGAEIKKWWNI